jgi:molybdenum cofactor synthesis domain-containing protein
LKAHETPLYLHIQPIKEAIMSNPSAAMLVIGDEILSGRTRDANMHFLAGELTKHGIDLREVRIVSDDPDAIVTAVQALSAAYNHVFTSGGIGPTHDDITADCIATAFATHIDIRDDASALLAAHYTKSGLELNVARLRMARIPDGAKLIENPVSIAPGFSLRNVHVMAGVPTVFQAMVASVLPTLTGGAPLLSQTLRIHRGEGDIAGPLADLASDFPGLAIGSYPFQKNGAFGSNIVIRGSDGAQVDAAMVRLAAIFPA